jgi:hypothetical protein
LSKPTDDASFLHSFTFDSNGRVKSSQRDVVQMDLAQHLELGVGGNGVIGRKISIFRDVTTDQPIAEGVIGWN